MGNQASSSSTPLDEATLRNMSAEELDQVVEEHPELASAIASEKNPPATTTTTTPMMETRGKKGAGKSAVRSKSIGKSSSVAESKKRRHLRRKSSGSLTANKPRRPASRGPERRSLPVLDEAPSRIVNPLVELPDTLRAADFWPLMDLWLLRPNTFSIAYMGRLLGYDVPTSKTTPLAWNPAMALKMDENVYRIPSEGSFASHVWRGNVDDDDDDGRVLGEFRDPLYRALLESNTDREETATRPVTAAQHEQLVATANLEYLHPVLDAVADTKLLVEPAITIISMADFRESHPEAGLPTVPTLCGLFLLKKDRPLALVSYEFQWYPRGQDYELILSLEDVRSSSSFLRRDFSTPNSELAARDKLLVLIMSALALEHARVNSVWYAIVKVPPALRQFFSRYFRMTPKTTEPQPGETTIDMVCDLHKCSYRYALLTLKADRMAESESQSLTLAAPVRRILARLPSVDEARAAMEVSPPVPKKVPPRKPSLFFGNAPVSMRQSKVRLRAKVFGGNQEDKVELYRVDGEAKELTLELPTFHNDVSIELLRDFLLPQEEQADRPTDTSDIYDELCQKQTELRAMEQAMEPHLRALMQKVVDERLAYEKEGESKRLLEGQKTLEDYRHQKDLQKELERALEEQQQHDMDAVCAVCNDGEVIPENKILFCDACNVAVHQMCYGIDEIPEDDYFCMPCRFLGRDEAFRSRSAGARKLAASPLPICCELCPQKQGAFLQTESDTPTSFGKWVHAVCAKWQGLNYVRVPDIVENVTELKVGFRRLGIKCILCQGERGCMNKCRLAGCSNWLHVTCARAVGTCDVVHGEDVRGPVAENPWTLMCPAHSNVKPGDRPKKTVSVEALVQLAKEFPPEPKPPPVPIAPKPFANATGTERRALLKKKDYEDELLVELTKKKIVGVKCEVCDQEVDSRSKTTRLRCAVCCVVICSDCSLDIDRAETVKYTCPACSFVKAKEKAGEECDTPQCIACCQPGGWLRPASASPFSKKSYWHLNKKEFQKTLFAKQLWAHSICTFWNPGKLVLSSKTGEVDCSNVVQTSGKGLVGSSSHCFLCGRSDGLKVKCAREGCFYFVNGQKIETVVHVTCARQAGLEVNHNDRSGKFYVKCYRHGGADFNLRAKMDDLIEVEKARAGQNLKKEDLPMSLAHASKLLNSAIGVVRVLGWAWRWAEFWVDYDSNWEPLLEPGEREEDFTSEQLKKVKSTRESRCADARRCRLAAFGAAVRNRSYDLEGEDDFDRESLDLALRDILATESLVGPLTQQEEDFFALWLSLAYWSKSRLLGFGQEKIDVNSDSPLCLHISDRSPKYVLGDRPLPGCSQAGTRTVDEPDDFLKSELVSDADLAPPKDPPKARIRSPRKGGVSVGTSASSSSPKKRVGRPPKKKGATTAAKSVSEDSIQNECGPPKKKRGRPFKRLAVSPDQAASAVSDSRSSSPRRLAQPPKRLADEMSEPLPPTKKRRGRPPKRRHHDDEQAALSTTKSDASESQGAVAPKRRGRPPKIRTVDESTVTEEPQESNDADVQEPAKLSPEQPNQTTPASEPPSKAESADSAFESRPPEDDSPVTRRRSRPPKNQSLSSTESRNEPEEAVPKRRGRPLRKSPPDDEETSQEAAVVESAVEPVPQKRRGRPPKRKPSHSEKKVQDDVPVPEPATKKRRGRPPKAKSQPITTDTEVAVSASRDAHAEETAPVAHAEETAPVTAETEVSDSERGPPKKRRGRPPKKRTPEESQPLPPLDAPTTPRSKTTGEPKLDSALPLKKRRGRTPSKFDIVKARRRQPTMRLTVGADDVNSKSYANPEAVRVRQVAVDKDDRLEEHTEVQPAEASAQSGGRDGDNTEETDTPAANLEVEAPPSDGAELKTDESKLTKEALDEAPPAAKAGETPVPTEPPKEKSTADEPASDDTKPAAEPVNESSPLPLTNTDTIATAQPSDAVPSQEAALPAAGDNLSSTVEPAPTETTLSPESDPKTTVRSSARTRLADHGAMLESDVALGPVPRRKKTDSDCGHE